MAGFSVARAYKMRYAGTEEKADGEYENMTKEQYEAWSAPFRNSKMGTKLLCGADRAVTAAVFFSYPALLCYLFQAGRVREAFFCVVVPAASFALLSCFRSLYSAKRPYEVLDIRPLLPKKTTGKSFPSRHVFSAFMIGMTHFAICRPTGILICALGAALAYIRVVCGVHFPKDTAAGALLGILSGCAYFILL